MYASQLIKKVETQVAFRVKIPGYRLCILRATFRYVFEPVPTDTVDKKYASLLKMHLQCDLDRSTISDLQ